LSSASASSEPAADLAHAAALAVMGVVPEVMRELRSAMRSAAPDSLTVPQFRALIFAWRQPAVTVGDLAAHLGVTVPTASVNVTRLAKAGWLVVASDTDDKRRRLISLTPAGQTLVEAAWARTARSFSNRLASLPDSALTQLREAMELLRVLRAPAV
jgi:DNA-binding MarR family transcriptional regulator